MLVLIKDLSSVKYISEKNPSLDSGSAVLEFVVTLTLLFLPLVIYFSHLSVEHAKNIEVNSSLREITQILEESKSLSQGIKISRLYLEARGIKGRLLVECLEGICPLHNSLLRVTIERELNSVSLSHRSSKWQ